MTLGLKVDPKTWQPVSEVWIEHIYPDYWPKDLPKPARANDRLLEKNRIWNRDGISWADAPKPPRWHRCFTQTYGVMDYFKIVERCPCGAIQLDGRSGWFERNSRKRD